MREGLDYKSDFQTGGLLERGIIELYGISVFVSLKGARIGASDVEIQLLTVFTYSANVMSLIEYLNTVFPTSSNKCHVFFNHDIN